MRERTDAAPGDAHIGIRHTSTVSVGAIARAFAYATLLLSNAMRSTHLKAQNAPMLCPTLLLQGLTYDAVGDGNDLRFDAVA